MREKISSQEAWDILENQKTPTPKIQKVFLHDALFRALAEDIIAREDMPLEDLSSMDGYALNTNNTQVNQKLTVIGEVATGKELAFFEPYNNQYLGKEGYIVKVLTGASVPTNYDTLIPFELTQRVDDKILISTLPTKGENIRKRGTNYKKGELLLKKGTTLTPLEIGLLASLNYVFIKVFCKPKVGILTCGNEILELGEALDDKNGKDSKVYNANAHLLFSALKALGCEPYLFDRVLDDKEQTQMALQTAFRECDVVLSSGGASAGDYDFMKACSNDMCDMIFRGLTIKPGKPLSFGIYSNQSHSYYFGLPGFPNSTFVTFYLFVVPFLGKMCGKKFYKPKKILATLSEKATKKDQREEFRSCSVRLENGKYTVNFNGKKDFLSAVLNNLCQSPNMLDTNATNALLVMPLGEVTWEANKEVEVILLEF